jgi:acyl-CoA dehydrogenase
MEKSNRKGIEVVAQIQEEQMIASMVDTLCRDIISKRAAEIDREDEFPEDIFRLFVDQGLFSLAFAEEYGGANVSMQCFSECIERISRESPACAMMLLISAIGSDCLLVAGSDELKSRILPEVSSGNVKVSFALTEPNAGSDTSAMATTARPVDDHYVINGSKSFITNAAVADYFAVFAKVIEDDEAKPSCFFVHKDTAGLLVEKKEEKLGLRGSITSPVYFDDMIVGRDTLIGKVGDGFKIAHHTLNRGRLAVAALSTGITAASLIASIEYSNNRKQFGKTISSFQAMRFMMADMEISLEASRLLTAKASTAFMEDSADMMRTASIAKVFCSEQAVKAAEAAIQIHGGYGLCNEYPVERYYRDAKAFTIIEGTNEIQRTLIAKSALKRVR